MHKSVKSILKYLLYIYVQVCCIIGKLAVFNKHVARQSVLKEDQIYCWSPVQGVNDSGKGEESVDIGRCVTRMISSSVGSKEQVHGM